MNKKLWEASPSQKKKSLLLSYEQFISKNSKKDLIKKNTFETEYSLEQYGLSLIREENRVIVDTLQWNGSAKKSGFETGDYISEFNIENADRPNK